MRKANYFICENKTQISCAVAAQLISAVLISAVLFNFMYITIPLLLKSKISSLQLSSVTLQFCLCQTWSEIPVAQIIN